MKLKDVLKENFGDEEVNFEYFIDATDKYLTPHTSNKFVEFAKAAANDLKTAAKQPDTNKLELQKLLAYLRRKWSVF